MVWNSQAQRAEDTVETQGRFRCPHSTTEPGLSRDSLPSPHTLVTALMLRNKQHLESQQLTEALLPQSLQGGWLSPMAVPPTHDVKSSALGIS
jgi:hypothetical protein